MRNSESPLPTQSTFLLFVSNFDVAILLHYDFNIQLGPGLLEIVSFFILVILDFQVFFRLYVLNFISGQTDSVNVGFTKVWHAIFYKKIMVLIANITVKSVMRDTF